MGSKLPDDPNLPYNCLRVRVHGSMFLAQPYYMKYRSGNCLLVDLQRGASELPVFTPVTLIWKPQR